jgi:hypothetical protein
MFRKKYLLEHNLGKVLLLIVKNKIKKNRETGYSESDKY